MMMMAKKLLKVWWKHVLFILFRRSNFQQMLNNFVNFELLFTKLSGIHPYEKLKNQVGMLGDMFLWLVANLKQGVIYFIKQGGRNHKIAWVYRYLV